MLFGVLGIGQGFDTNPFQVRIFNNTSSTVIVHSHFGAAHGTRDDSANGMTVTLQSAHAFDDTVIANEGVEQDRVSDRAGKTMGCLPFQFSENTPATITVKITEMVPCKSWVIGQSSKEDWPNHNF
jgi:hypothetical protein